VLSPLQRARLLSLPVGRHLAKLLEVDAVGPVEPAKDLVDCPCEQPCGLGREAGLLGRLLDGHDQTALGAKPALVSECHSLVLAGGLEEQALLG